MLSLFLEHLLACFLEAVQPIGCAILILVFFLRISALMNDMQQRGGDMFAVNLRGAGAITIDFKIVVFVLANLDIDFIDAVIATSDGGFNQRYPRIFTHLHAKHLTLLEINQASLVGGRAAAAFYIGGIKLRDHTQSVVLQNRPSYWIW